MAAGYINPVVSPVYGDALEDIFHAVIMGLTGITATLIRPRWQPEPPNQPAFTDNWCAFGITSTDPDLFAYQRHDPLANGGLGMTSVDRDERLEVLHSFYGPLGQAMCARYRDGIMLSQNRYDLTQAGVKLVQVNKERSLPALLKERWVKRVDVLLVFSRRTSRSYGVPSLAGGSLGLDNEHYITPIVIDNT